MVITLALVSLLAMANDKAKPVEVGRVRVDATTELALEAAPCKGKRRALLVVVHEAGARKPNKPLDIDVACDAKESVLTSGEKAFGGTGEGEASVSVATFRMTPERNALVVLHEEGFEWVRRTGIVVDAKRGALARNASHWGMGGIAFGFSIEPSALGAFDELMVVDASHFADAAGYRAERIRFDGTGKATVTQLPLYALIYKTEVLGDAGPMLDFIELPCAPLFSSTHGTDGWPKLAPGKRVLAEMFTSEAEAQKALAKAKKCAPDAYVKRAR